jgi:tight adherence protein C
MHTFWILAGFFGAVMAGTALLSYMVLSRESKDQDRQSPLLETLRRIGRAAPVRPQESDRLRTRLRLAGYVVPSAASIFSGIRVACAGLLGLVIFSIALYSVESLYQATLGALCAALVGFILPNLILNRWIRNRAQRLRAGLPMVLDLLVLGLEAGQSLDAALIETGHQLREPFPDLCAELSLVQLEIFANKSRAQAFRNLATRNEEIEIRRLAQVLIDSDRFGTSLAPALRTHVHYLRLRMRQKARETARKVSVKLVFPLFFLIFPAVLLVTLGPAILQVVSQLGPMLTSAMP